MKTKRLNAWVLSALLVVFTVFPQKHSYAVLPALAVTAISSGAGAAAVDVGATAVATLVGSSIVALGVMGQLPGQQTYNELRIPLTDDPAKQNQAMPAPVAEPLVQPSSATKYCKYHFCSGSLGGLCSAIAADAGTDRAYLNGEWCSLSEGDLTQGQQAVPNWEDLRGSAVFSLSCKTGYVLNGNDCNLTTPKLAASDNKNDVSRTASGYQFGSNFDADSGSSVSPSGAPNSAPSPKVSVVGKNSKGEPVVIEITRNSDASTDVKVSTQSQVANNTVVKQQNLAISPDSVVIAASESVMPGQITNIETQSPVVTADPNQKVFSSDIQFPSDYARQGEAAQAANILRPSLDSITTKLTDTQTVSDPEVPEYPDLWGKTFDKILDWKLPSHSSECPTGSFEFNNRTFTIDVHCQLISNYFGSMSAVMNVVWVVFAFYIVMGA